MNAENVDSPNQELNDPALTGHLLGLPVLYSFRRCPYAMRARLAIVAAGVKVEVRELVLRAKPPHMLEISPKGTVPVLWLQDGTVIDESLDVMRWAVSQNFPSDWLVLNDAQQRQGDEWIALLDGEFKRNLDRYKYPHRYHVNTPTETYVCDPLEHRNVCVAILVRWNEVLESNGAFLFGGKPSFADYAILPFVRQFRIADEAWFDSMPGCDALKAWLGVFLASNILEQAMPKLKPWQLGDEPLTFPG
ncbi:glutathione S-transferase [Limnobacter thiooxidans]|uniref:glutathione S-transferase n=1 Tax=Limnobacter TaxID=131079 RepID=UPI0010EB69F6|nr:glutathione S-transferase [Limnobacter sp.]MCZ8014164.1 glutathione S-transferase [Limnobacter sp.]RZS38143.1 glutathione S-transferase [Limnobacter thiooxidans]